MTAVQTVPQAVNGALRGDPVAKRKLAAFKAFALEWHEALDKDGALTAQAVAAFEAGFAGQPKVEPVADWLAGNQCFQRDEARAFELSPEFHLA